jgi:asparagine synthase (glutamine-hydrolysing)
MCGIAGIIAKNEQGEKWMDHIRAATASLNSRGPDAQQFFLDAGVALGHCRLTIIDLSDAASQPMSDASSRYCIIYNGEIFNYKALRKVLEASGVAFHTNSDTEVLLQLYIAYGSEMLQQLNGFFAFAIYDSKEQSCFIARDRFGVKPLYYYSDDNCLLFASEIKALMQFPVHRNMDMVSFYEYLQLNYIAAPNTIYTAVKKLLPGHYLQFKRNNITLHPYYNLNESSSSNVAVDYSSKQEELWQLLEDAVRIRLVSDVPLGAFLSGGIDSSIVVGLAAKYTPHLKTFSIGYSDHAFFDETPYAKAVAAHFKTDHTVFTLTRNDLFESVSGVLDYLDEPFADSSALPVYLLSALTRKEVKVALSGDGADELFGGYVKHNAEYRARHPRLPEVAVASLRPLLELIPKSRHTYFSNKMRQLDRFAEGLRLSDKERYWRWCCISNGMDARSIIKNLSLNDFDKFKEAKEELIRFIHAGKDLNNVLLNDVHLVLPNDMLNKVDSMSMAHGLEVRTPFLDYRVAELAFSIPSSYKTDQLRGKKIVRDAFRNFLPPALYHRPKHGFEIPLHRLLTHELHSSIDQLLSPDFLRSQNIFEIKAVDLLRRQLFSSRPGDSAARVWALLVFQHWWRKWMIG